MSELQLKTKYKINKPHLKTALHVESKAKDIAMAQSWNQNGK